MLENTKLEDLMDHVDYFFGNIRTIEDKDHEFEVYLKDDNWNIKDLRTKWTFGTTDHLMALEHLVKMSTDIEQFHILMYNIVCTEGVLNRMERKKIESLVGRDAIDNQETAYDITSKEMAERITETLNVSRLSLVGE